VRAVAHGLDNLLHHLDARVVRREERDGIHMRRHRRDAVIDRRVAHTQAASQPGQRLGMAACARGDARHVHVANLGERLHLEFGDKASPDNAELQALHGVLLNARGPNV